MNEKEEKGLGELRLKKLATEIHYIRRLFEQFNHCVCYSVNIEDVDASKGLTELYESQMINLRAKFQKNPKCREDLMLNFPFSFYSLCTNHVQFLTLNFSLHIMVELGIGKFSMLTDEAALVNRLTIKSLIIFSDRK